MKRVTIKDIAQRLGVNPSTVSRALKDHPDIGLALRTEIKQLAHELHYHPNQMAVYLRQRSSRLIGLITPEVTMFFYPSVIRGIQHVLHEHGYNLIMLPSNESLEREIENIRICSENDVAGIMLAFSRYTQSSEHMTVLEEIGAPVVMFDKIREDLPYDSVVLEDFESAVVAVRHLAQTGCRRIAGIFGNPHMRITQLRLEGFKHALHDSNLPCPDEFIRFSDSAYEAEKCARALMAMSPAPDGIFAMTDEIIIGSLPAIATSGKKIPEECAVICISDGFLPYCLHPQVTFLHHDGYEVGRLAAERMLQLIESGVYKNDGYRGEKMMLKARLIELATTRRKNDVPAVSDK
ncbi:MAG: LacI family DNA-binding transcriptional regulator [Saprospiraceae bacterium]|nr:LacI family DNA-binding transcriptional regulator [Saprospiraceae bacterium]